MPPGSALCLRLRENGVREKGKGHLRSPAVRVNEIPFEKRVRRHTEKAGESKQIRGIGKADTRLPFGNHAVSDADEVPELSLGDMVLLP